MATPVEVLYDDEGNPFEPLDASKEVSKYKDAVTALLAAYLIPGPGREIHYAAVRKLHDEWPTLAIALDRLVGEELPKRLK